MKRQEQRCRRHTEHVAEVGAGGRQNVFECVGERPAAFVNTVAQDVEVVFEQHQVRCVFRHIHGGIHRDTDVGAWRAARR